MIFLNEVKGDGKVCRIIVVPLAHFHAKKTKWQSRKEEKKEIAPYFLIASLREISFVRQL